jgi:Uma2 family endonuclease
LLRNTGAGVASEPDAMFVSKRTLANGRVKFTAGQKRGAQATEMVGTPDLVIEVVSPSSVDKDFEWLMSAYHNAGIGEYWLIDARAYDVRFDIHKRGPRGFTTSRKVDGWVKSRVLARSFRLTRGDETHGIPTYTLDIR